MRTFFTLGNKKKLLKAKFGEYGGWLTTVIAFRLKNWRTKSETWAVVLSWCRIQEFSLNISGRIWQTCSHKRFRTSMWLCWLFDPGGCIRWFTTPRISKKTMTLVLMFERLCCSFFECDSPSSLQSRLCDFRSKSYS